MDKFVELKSPFTGGRVREVSTIEEHEFRKEKFSVYVGYYVCKDTGEKFTTTEQDGLLFNELYSQYRVNHSILFPEEIKAIRQRYGLNYQQITKILGFGTNQYQTLLTYEGYRIGVVEWGSQGIGPHRRD